MARRREDRAISKHTLNLYAGDYQKLQHLYGSRIGAAKIIRDVVHAHVRRIEENAAQKADAAKLAHETELDIGGPSE